MASPSLPLGRTRASELRNQLLAGLHRPNGILCSKHICNSTIARVIGICIASPWRMEVSLVRWGINTHKLLTSAFYKQYLPPLPPTLLGIRECAP